MPSNSIDSVHVLQDQHLLALTHSLHCCRASHGFASDAAHCWSRLIVSSASLATLATAQSAHSRNTHLARECKYNITVTHKQAGRVGQVVVMLQLFRQDQELQHLM